MGLQIYELKFDKSEEYLQCLLCVFSGGFLLNQTIGGLYRAVQAEMVPCFGWWQARRDGKPAGVPVRD